jgi:flagellar L-ring protein precursor FlgH
VAPRAATGSLFNSASYRPGVSKTARTLVGDTVTIQIVENVTASQKSSSTANRTFDVRPASAPFPSPVSAGQAGSAPRRQRLLRQGRHRKRQHLLGSITATVVDVLPNGHLVVAGEKQIGVNQNVDVLRFSGTVDPRVVQPGSM